MNKRFRFCLFAILLIALLGVTALCVAADGNYQVLNDSDSVVGSYATLTAAKDVVRDGYTVRLLGDTTETAVTNLNVGYAYTIDGNGHTITNNATGSVFLNVSAGSVTLTDVALSRNNTSKDLIYIAGTGTVTLDGVTLSGGRIQVNLDGATTLTIRGDSTFGAGCGTRILHLGNSSRGGTATIENGVFTALNVSEGCIKGSGARLIVTGGTFNASSSSAIIDLNDSDYVSPVDISGGFFNVPAGSANCAIAYKGTGDLYNAYADRENVIVSITGGMFTANDGAYAILFSSRTSTKNKGDGCLGSERPVIAVSGGSFSGSHAWLRSSANTVFRISDTPTFTSNATDSTATRCIWLHNASQNGLVDISGGTFTTTGNAILINAAGADINISGGTFAHKSVGIFIADGDRVSNVTVSGGSFTANGTTAYTGYGSTIFFDADENPANAKKGSVTISGGTFNAPNGAYSLYYDAIQVGSFCNITGGTFHGAIVAYDHLLSPLTITGGSFSQDVTHYVPGRGAGGITESAGTYTVNTLNLPVFCGTQLALGKSLTLYIYAVVPTDAVSANEAKHMSLKVTMPGRYTVLTDPEALRAYPDGSPVDAGYTLLRFTFAGIAPQYMNDTLNAELRRANDAVYATTNASYSIRQYCQALLSDGDIPAGTKTLVSDLLCYGAAAQNYVGYRTDALVTTGVTGMTASSFTTISGAPAAVFGGSGSNGYKLTECGLHFDSLNRLFVRFTAPDPDAVKITYSVAGEDRGRAVIRTDGLGYIAYTDGLVTTDFDKAVIFTMTDNNDKDGVSVATQTCSYSAKTFMQNNQNNDGEPNVKALARTLANYQASAAPYLDSGFDPVLRFVAISDIHFMTDNDTSSTTTIMPTQAHDLARCIERLTALFTDSYAYAATQDYGTIDAFMIVGDNTDDGTEKQIADFFSIVKDNLDSSESRLLIVNGNHEFYDTGESGSGGNAHTTTDARLTAGLAASGITNYNGLKFHTTVNGYHFIGFSPTNSGGRAFSDEVADWLDEEIAAAVAANTAAGRPNDPVFVCQHQQVCATVYGCPSTGSTYAQANIRSVLAKYPQVVDFAGHSHSYIDHPHSVWQGEFTALSTGTLAYSSNPTNTRGGSHASGHSDPYNEHNEKDTAEFTIVELDANNRMRLRYFYLSMEDNTTAIPIGERIINVGDSSKFNWTVAKDASWTAPYFTEGQELTRNAVETPTSLQINIPQATCDAGVATYRCDLWLGGSLIKTVTRRSGQFAHPFDECVVPFTGLTPNTTYTVKVYPVSNTGGIGMPLVAAFTTAAQDSVYTPDVFSAQFNSDGTVINAVNGDVLVKGGAATATEGKATFTGAGDFEWRGIEPYYELIQTTFTMEAYAKVTDASRGKFIVGNLEYHIPPTNASRTQLHGGFGFKVESDGRISFYMLTSNTSVSWSNVTNEVLLQHAVTTTAAYDNNEYVHLVGTYDGASFKFYVNGELVGTRSSSGVMDYPLKITTQYLSIGGDSGIDYNSRDFMTGEISKVNIYSTVMTADQVTTLYNNR